jgi:hypothetical protein
MTSLIVLSSLSFVYTQRWLRVSLLGSQGGGIQVEEEFNPCIRVNGLLGKNDSKFCPSLYSQDLLGFDSLSRDWILKC